MKDLRTEMYQLVYEEPIYPKNLYLDRPPFDHAGYKANVTDRQIELMHERGIWVKPTPSPSHRPDQATARRTAASGNDPVR
jgi:hypothetical protein